VPSGGDREVEQREEGRRLLRAGDGVAPVEHEERHRLDAQFPGAHVARIDIVHALRPRQVDRRGDRVEPGAMREVGQGRRVADVDRFREVGGVERLHHRRAPPEPVRPLHEAMGVHRVGRAADAVVGHGQAIAPRRLGHGGGDLARPLHPAELRREIEVALDPAGRHLGVEAERLPADVGRHVRPVGHGTDEPSPADVAPRADDVGVDVDLHARPPRRRPSRP
jgi:hypothetical protein